MSRGPAVAMTSSFDALLGAGDGTADTVGPIGLEHEYRLSCAGRPLDFRTVIHRLAISGLRLDPGDTNAYRCPSGMAVTCDDDEAEVASPPLSLGPRFARDIDGWHRPGAPFSWTSCLERWPSKASRPI